MSQNCNKLEDAINEMHNKIQKKQLACNLAEAEYNVFCSQVDVYLKNLQKAKSKKFQLETHLNACKYRLAENTLSEKEFDVQICNAKKCADNIREKMSEELHNMHGYDKTFDYDVVALAEKLCRFRESYDKSVLVEELQQLYDENHSISKELQEIKNCIKQLKSKFPLTPNETIKYITTNIGAQRPLLKKEIEKSKSNNLSYRQKSKVLEANKSLLLQEIEKIKM